MFRVGQSGKDLEEKEKKMNVLIVQDLFDGYGVRMLTLVEGD